MVSKLEKQAEQLETRAKQLRDQARKEFIDDFPKVGERVLVECKTGEWGYRYAAREATVTQAWPTGSGQMIVEFDEWLYCDECRQKTRRKWDRVNRDQIIQRNLPKKNLSTNKPRV